MGATAKEQGLKKKTSPVATEVKFDSPYINFTLSGHKNIDFTITSPKGKKAGRNLKTGFQDATLGAYYRELPMDDETGLKSNEYCRFDASGGASLGEYKIEIFGLVSGKFSIEFYLSTPESSRLRIEENIKKGEVLKYSFKLNSGKPSSVMKISN